MLIPICKKKLFVWFYPESVKYSETPTSGNTLERGITLNSAAGSIPISLISLPVS